MQPTHRQGANLSSNAQPAVMIRAASISSQEATRPTTPIHQNTFLTHIHHLFPHHALFHVKLHIHQISSVPLVRGEFGVRWKFRKAQANRSGGFLQKVKPKGKERAMQASPGPSKPRDLSDDSDDDNDTNDGSQTSQSALVPAVVVTSDIDPTRSFSSNSSASSALLDSNISTSSANTGASHTNTYVKSGARRASDNQSISSAAPRSPTRENMTFDNSNEGYSAPLGMTAYLPLREHGVNWEHTVNVVVQMAIDRDTRELQTSPLKLVVLQRVIPGDIDAPSNPRLGAVYLNLAEYVSAGSVTRRYLLRESKTNATLRLTIEVNHVGGESSYIAPPLPKGEIFGGVAGILENDVYRTRPRTLEVLDTLSLRHSQSRSNASTIKKPLRASDIDLDHIPSTVGLRATEVLIEALFNPVPSTSQRQSPFTYYAPYPSRRGKLDAGDGTLPPGPGPAESVASFESMDSAFVSVKSGVSGEDGNGEKEFGETMTAQRRAQPVKSWWGRKVSKARPATPVV